MELFSRRIWTTGSAQHVWNIAILYVQDNLFQFIKHPTLVKLGPTLPSSPSTKELHGESKRVIICPIETNALDPAAAEAIPKSFPFKRHYFRLRAVTLSLSTSGSRCQRRRRHFPEPKKSILSSAVLLLFFNSKIAFWTTAKSRRRRCLCLLSSDARSKMLQRRVSKIGNWWKLESSCTASTSVTRLLYYLFNISPFATIKIWLLVRKYPKVGSTFCWILNKLAKVCKRVLKFCQWQKFAQSDDTDCYLLPCDLLWE